MKDTINPALPLVNVGTAYLIPEYRFKKPTSGDFLQSAAKSLVIPPFPWREGIKGRGIHPHLTSPDRLLAALKKHAPKSPGLFAAGLRRYRRPATLRGDVVAIDIVAGGQHGYLAPFIMEGTRPHMITSTRSMPIKYGDEVVSFA